MPFLLNGGFSGEVLRLKINRHVLKCARCATAIDARWSFCLGVFQALSIGYDLPAGLCSCLFEVSTSERIQLGGMSMKIDGLAARLNISDEALAKTQSDLGLEGDSELSPNDLDRLKDVLVKSHGVDPRALEKLRSDVVSGPTLPEPRSVGTPVRSAGSSDVGRLDLSAFGNLGRNIAARRERTDLILERKTRNCGDTAGMVLEGLRKSMPTSTVRDLGLEQVLTALGKPAEKHEVWDITVHQHTFTLERHPDGSNMLIQSYQPGYNVQHWCGLDDPYVDNPALVELPKTWFRPTDAQVAELGRLIESLYAASSESQKEIWSQLPFNPDDPLVVSERMEKLAFDANVISIDESASAGVTLTGLKDSIAELGG